MKNVKLFRVELREHSVPVEGSKKPQPLKYADLLRAVILSPGAEGSSTDDLAASVAAWLPIKADIAAGKTETALDEESHALLLRKLAAFRWTVVPDAAEYVADFIAYVRGLKASDFTATPAG